MQESRAITRKSASNLALAFILLPRPRRDAMSALYAFCREVDDVVDEVPDVGVARTKLAWWRTEVANLFAGHPQHPVTKALAPFTASHGIDAGRMNEIIDGMEMDLAYHRYPDFDSLKLYCHRAAGVVGQLSASIFGYSEASTLEYAEALGIAFQLTNIIRDVGEDARRGRVYLPQDELARFGLTPEDILERKGGLPFVKLMRFQSERAQSYYDLAFSKLAPADRRSQRAGFIMAAIYRTLLDEIQRDDFQVLEQRVTLTPMRKLWIAWKTWVRG